MRFASLGSGSRGNATLVESGRTALLLDCGFGLRETERRLARLGTTAARLTALVVTHEHGDHLRGVFPLARKYALPVWMTPGTLRQSGAAASSSPRLFSCHEPLAIGDLELHPFPVPHDAGEPTQFVLTDGCRRLGVLTDTGWVTPHIVDSLKDCDALLLECNHDPELLRTGPYPPALKRRVGGKLGHLSNAQAADLLGRVDQRRLQHVAAAHLSEQNNTPNHARSSLAAVLGCTPDEVDVAGQAQGLAWRALA